MTNAHHVLTPAILTAMALVAACGGVQPPGANEGMSSEPEKPTGPADGTWNGTTSQGKPISFTIAKGALLAITAQYSLPGFIRCTVVEERMLVLSLPSKIKDDSIYEYVQDHPVSYSFEAHFSSKTTALGKLRVNFNGQCYGSGDLTWQATNAAPSVPPGSSRPSASKSAQPPPEPTAWQCTYALRAQGALGTDVGRMRCTNSRGERAQADRVARDNCYEAMLEVLKLNGSVTEYCQTLGCIEVPASSAKDNGMGWLACE